MRAPAFVTGGTNTLPLAARGKHALGLLHHVDVARTLAALGGANDSAMGDDGFDMWSSMVLGSDASAAASPRTELPINIDIANGIKMAAEAAVQGNFSALIQGDMKLINVNGGNLYDGWWSNDPQSVEQPDEKAALIEMNGCKNVGLFNLTSDPNERNNLAAAMPDVVAKMQARIAWFASTENGYVAQQANTPHPLSLPKLHNGTWAPWRK